MEIKNKDGVVLKTIEGESLKGADLSGANLCGADLSGAKISIGNRKMVIP